MKSLLTQIKQCTICIDQLEHGVNPVVSAHPKSKIVIIGQAPGSIVHQTGIPWNDKSGERLRDWLGVDKATFYNEEIFAIIPMGFCYPGRGKTGDLPPKKECAPKWHALIFEELKHVELVVLIGSYAQNYYLQNAKKTLTETVRNYHEYLPKYMVLPHPSPRNNIWIRKNEWFEKENLKHIKEHIHKIITL